MGAFTDGLAALGEPEAESWDYAERMKPGLRDYYLKCRAAYRMIEAEVEDELPGSVLQSTVNRLANFKRLFDTIEGTPFGAANFNQVVDQTLGGLQELMREWSQDLRPHLGRPTIASGQTEWSIDEKLAQASTLLDQATEVRAQLEELTAKAAALLTETGTGELAHHYAGQADKHRSAATRALWAVVVTTVFLVVVGWAVVATIPDTKEWTNLAREVLARLFLVGALAYALALASRIYRVNSHLTVVYEQKAHALRTFSLFTKSIQDDESRGMVLSELVRAVFAPAETGLVDASPERTVIESASPLIAALARQRS